MIVHICIICGKEFDDAPYFVMEGRVAVPICSTGCLDYWIKFGGAGE